MIIHNTQINTFSVIYKYVVLLATKYNGLYIICQD